MENNCSRYLTIVLYMAHIWTDATNFYNPSFTKDRAHLIKKGKERAPISSAKPDTCGGPVDGEESGELWGFENQWV